MPDPRILYSANTLLGYRIAKRYFSDCHYVWVTNCFGSNTLEGKVTNATPPTSRPIYRYKALEKESAAGDRHGPFIAEQRSGLKRGVEAKFKDGIISDADRREILEVIEEAQPADFRPLMYAMAYDQVKPLLQTVPVKERAHPLSFEYVIPELPGDMFDVLNLNPDFDDI